MKIVPKLNLNGNPKVCDNGSLVFAKNMKVNTDGYLVSDYGYENIEDINGENIVGHIVGLDNKVYFFSYEDGDSFITEYDEINKTTKRIECTWTYSGGKIDGCVTTNISGEKILTICEYDVEDKKIPIKHINLTYCNSEDDESIYCQAPKVPVTNIGLIDTYSKTIPNGTYVFYIRYLIREGVYTPWYLASRPMFAGVSESLNTIQGTVKQINIHKDSGKSFILSVNHVFDNNINIYKKFQLGFIISHDDSTNARSWKTFDISNTSKIYFDYDEVNEENIDDFTKTNYELYNVGNITSFKNKLYIGNYNESDLNDEELKELAKCITVESKVKDFYDAGSEIKYKDYDLVINDDDYYDKSKDGTLFKNLISNSDFVIEASTSSDIETTKQDAITFKTKYEANINPDVVRIDELTSNINGKLLLGHDYKAPTNNPLDTLRLIYDSYVGGHYWVYDINSGISVHPWYLLGLSFMYGCTSGSTYTKMSETSKNYNYNGRSCWLLRNNGFTTENLTAIYDNIETEIESISHCCFAYAYIMYGGNKYKLNYYSDLDRSDYIIPNNTIAESIINGLAQNTQDLSGAERDIQNRFYNIIWNNVVGVMVDTEHSRYIPMLNVNGNIIPGNNIYFVYKRYKLSTNNETTPSQDDPQIEDWSVDLNIETFDVQCSLLINSDIVDTPSGTSDFHQQSSLMTHTKYNVYAHFIDEHNIISNGVFVNEINTDPLTDDTDLIVLKYGISNVPSNSKYKGFFLSLEQVGNTIMECFNYSHNGNTHYLHCLELDSLLYNLNDNITIIKNDLDESEHEIVVTENAKYCSSGESNPILAFGNCGFITWDSEDSYTNSDIFLVRIEKDISEKKDGKLIKCTDYLPFSNTIEDVTIENGFYGSYFCIVSKPDFTVSSGLYVAGRDVYTVTRTSTNIQLAEVNNPLNIVYGTNKYIRSNFNLNYLSLSEDINDQIFSSGSNSQKQVAKVINSAELSFIYKLESMYKDFFNHSFFDYKENLAYGERRIDNTRFDNTLRLSNTLSDEASNNSVFTFEPTEYYNVPADRGIIVKLFSIANEIFVHTKSSLYKFDASQTIVSTEKDIQLKEGEPFELGITQVLDSEFGYGGIENKNSGCVTFNSYFFYDRLNNHIFGYEGNSNIKLIDQTIHEMLKAYNIIDCNIIHDEKNNRVLFGFTIEITRTARAHGRHATIITSRAYLTISYNYKTASFVSLHDLTLEKAFNSRENCYSYKNALLTLFNGEEVDSTTYNDYYDTGSGDDTWMIYGEATEICHAVFADEIHKADGTIKYYINLSPFMLYIISPNENDKLEVLDSIKYIADDNVSAFTTKFIMAGNPPVQQDVINIPKNSFTNPVDKFFCITDTCQSSDVNSKDENDEDSIDDTNRNKNRYSEYKGFVHDLGSWNCNYFRDIINNSNPYGYPTPNVGLNSDNNSLVYGRYFILAFAFKKKAIRFESIFINSKD